MLPEAFAPPLAVAAPARAAAKPRAAAKTPARTARAAPKPAAGRTAAKAPAKAPAKARAKPAPAAKKAPAKKAAAETEEGEATAKPTPAAKKAPTRKKPVKAEGAGEPERLAVTVADDGSLAGLADRTRTARPGVGRDAAVQPAVGEDAAELLGGHRRVVGGAALAVARPRRRCPSRRPLPLHDVGRREHSEPQRPEHRIVREGAHDAGELVDLLAADYTGEIGQGRIGPVIGTHGGPGVLGVSFWVRP